MNFKVVYEFPLLSLLYKKMSGKKKKKKALAAEIFGYIKIIAVQGLS